MTDVLRLDGPGILFTHAELADRQSGEVRLATGFAQHLAALRMTWGKPMAVTSCCRSFARNAAIGGHPNSLHVYDRPNHGLDGTAAIDIAMTDGHEARDLVALAIKQGWSVGVPKARFIHLDRRDLANLPPAIFGY